MIDGFGLKPRKSSDGVLNIIKSIVQKIFLLEKSYSLLPICIWNHWQLVVICNKGDNDMSFLILLDSLHMGEPTRIENELKNFLKIAYEGKEMRAMADELKIIDLHVPNLTADWFSRVEYEKFREDLQGKGIHIDAQSASTSKDKIRDIRLTKQSSTSSSIASVGDTYEQVLRRDRTGRVHGIGTGPTAKSLWGLRSEQKLRQDNESLKQQIDALKERMKKIESHGNNEDSLVGRRVRILNFSRQVIASGILMSDDNDNVVMGKKLGGEYYEVSILIAHDPTASLFIKDADRKNMNDVVGSHIIWFKEYVELEDN
ncbi:hypothetical protein Taro_011518 [Colocasia esculenta]|uniref:Uncharacterized protein n=1 Tax=Colocasia esculenta TaxID=4460 RepID=A0A843UCU2_COLES|nr:hypothetical protein [Colocasia esculenta]